MRAWLVILGAAASQLPAPEADACSGNPETGITTGVLPASGSLAPRNTRIWIPSDVAGNPVEPTDISVTAVAPNDDVLRQVSMTASIVLIEGESDVPVVVLEPIEPFAAGARVLVTVRGELTELTISADVDTEAPAKPRIDRVDVVGGYFGGFSCPESARVTVTIAGQEDLLLLTRAPAAAIPSRALAMGQDDHVRAVDLAEGDHSLHLLAIDLAGNVTATPVPELTVPTEQSGCSAGRGAGWLPFALLVLVTAFARSGSRCARSGVAARRARRTDRGCSTAR